MPSAGTHQGPSPGVDPRQQFGRDGEGAAREALRSCGYVILAERFRVAHGEIDIVARDHETIVFIEVKTRRGRAYGGGAAAVTWRKQRTIVRVAEAFLARARLSHLPCRFDVVAVDWPTGEGPRTEIIRGAFDAR
ncbi:YraN family protein [Luteitalea sp.]